MELEQIRELIGLMKENDLTELRIIEGDKRLLLKRGPGELPQVVAMPAPAPVVAAAAPAPGATQKVADSEVAATINSPMVGTFYVAPAPDAAPYVRPGDHVNPDTIVCIIEAMKVFNEITTETAGRVVEVMARSGELVQAGAVLMLIELAE